MTALALVTLTAGCAVLPDAASPTPPRIPGATPPVTRTTPAPPGAPPVERAGASVSRLIEYVDLILALPPGQLPGGADPIWAGILGTIANDAPWVDGSGLAPAARSAYRIAIDGLGTAYTAIRSRTSDADRASQMLTSLGAERTKLLTALAALK